MEISGFAYSDPARVLVVYDRTHGVYSGKITGTIAALYHEPKAVVPLDIDPVLTIG